LLGFKNQVRLERHRYLLRVYIYKNWSWNLSLYYVKSQILMGLAWKGERYECKIYIRFVNITQVKGNKVWEGLSIYR